MKDAFLITIALALAGIAAPGVAQPGTQTNTTVFRAGNWYVVRSTHNTTGAVGCTGFYMGHPGVQLSKESLIVRVPGEIKSIGMRFGDEPARAARTPQAAEKQIGAVVLAGADFDQLRKGKTLALDVTTAQGRGNHTFQLAGLDGALKNINDGCPLTQAAKRAERAAQKTREKVQAERCSPKGIARMQEMGIHELRIRSACPKADLTPR
jgi:hypothetical protein